MSAVSPYLYLNIVYELYIDIRGWAETKQFLFILKIYNNDKYPKQNQIGAKYVSTLYSTAKYQIKVF